MFKVIRNLTLAHKIWITISLAIIGTILFSYILSNYFYEKYYVENVRRTLQEEGSQLATNYNGGEITDQLLDQINWYNQMSEPEVLLITNPRELSACLPFDIDYESYIDEEDRERLLRGEHVSKIGYEQRLGHQILGVIIPLLDGNRLEGIIYLYTPLANITDMINDITNLWIPVAVLFVILSILLGRKIIAKLIQPLKQLEQAAQHMSKGNYTERVKISTNDEIGKLAQAFNDMACAIAKEDERKKEFLANVSHELRTPISYVKGYSEAIVDGVVKKQEDVQRFLKLIYREAARMQRLVHDLLDLSKLESSVYNLTKVPLVFSQSIEESLAIYEPILLESEISLNMMLDPEIIIYADEDRIEQIIHNLIDNAMHYTDKGGNISVQLKKVKNNECELIISDTGIGMDEKHLDQLGERFYRINKARTRKDGGTGLGLAIVKQIVVAHNGNISFYSKLGEGTQVHITFPVLTN
ncbi:sensor histidine kinase [Cytobacillus sp. Hm23]